MTHDDRVYHHLYETNEGILEHSERIALLEELVIDLVNCLGHDSCPADCKMFYTCNVTNIDEWWYVARIQELGLEDE